MKPLSSSASREVGIFGNWLLRRRIRRTFGESTIDVGNKAAVPASQKEVIDDQRTASDSLRFLCKRRALVFDRGRRSILCRGDAMSDLKTLRTLLVIAKDIRGGPPDIVWDAFDHAIQNEKRVAYSRSVINQLLHRPMTDMSMRDAYALGSTIAFLNFEIERLESQAKPFAEVIE